MSIIYIVFMLAASLFASLNLVHGAELSTNQSEVSKMKGYHWTDYKFVIVVIMSAICFALLWIIRSFTTDFGLPTTMILILVVACTLIKGVGKERIAVSLIFGCIFAGLSSIARSDVKSQVVVISTGVAGVLVVYLLNLFSDTRKSRTAAKIITIDAVIPVIFLLILLFAAIFVIKNILLPLFV